MLLITTAPLTCLLQHMQDESDKLIVVERGDLVFCFNFHPVKSYNDYRIGCLLPGPYKVGSLNASKQPCI